MAGGGHQKQNDEGDKPEGLKRQGSDRTVKMARNKNAQQWVEVAARMIGGDHKKNVNQSQQETGYPGVTAVIEER